jgi:hypothetical protein
VLGDVFCTGERLGPTVDLLRGAHAVGVWGNHDPARTGCSTWTRRAIPSCFS